MKSTIVKACLLASFAYTSHATLLVEESFTGYTDGVLEGQDASATGLTGAWSAQEQNISGEVTSAGGLTFGSLVTSGGAVTITNNGIHYLSCNISATSTAGNTIWVSYLFNNTSFSVSASDTGVTVNGVANDGGWGLQHHSYFGEGFNISTADNNTYIYQASTVTLDTTYIMVGKFDSIGAGNGAYLYTAWQLDAAGFAAFKLAGGDEAALDANAIAVTSVTTNGAYANGTFNGGTLTLGGYNEGTSVGLIDEIRFGTDLASVTPTGAPANGLQTFRSNNSLAADGSQDLLTPANDGVANLLKYAFNMLGTGTGQAATLTAPNTATLAANGSAGLPFAGIGTGEAAGKLQLTYIRRKPASNSGITYAVEFSSALASWAVNPAATETMMSIDAIFERVTVTDSAAATRRFGRVCVTNQ